MSDEQKTASEWAEFWLTDGQPLATVDIIRRIQNATLERAAKVAENIEYVGTSNIDLVNAIRALKEPS